MQDITQIQHPTTTARANSSPPAISGHKEHAPISQAKSEFVKPADAQPEITPSHPELKIGPELENIVEKGSDAREPKIEKNMPVNLAKESTPVITAPTGSIRLPMTYQEALQKEKKSAFWDSMHWFAAQIIYLCRKHDLYNIKKT